MVSRASLTVLPQIEHANIVNLDWALAHMDAVRSKNTRRKAGAAEDWVYDAEMKDSIEDVSAMLHYALNPTLMLRWRRILKVLGPYFWMKVRVVSIRRVLINIPVPSHVSDVPEILEDSVSKILESRGIKYSHRNDDILVPNTIEEQQMRKARKVGFMGLFGSDG
jgi:hypothetical protein